jgi:hypothetical protein
MAGLMRNARKAQRLATAGRFLQALAVAESAADDFQQALADSVSVSQ